MSETLHPEPWDALQALVAAGDAAAAKTFLEELSAPEVARTLSRLSDDSQNALLTLIGPSEAAELLVDLSDAQAVDIIEDLSPVQAAAIIEELPSAERADLLGELDTTDADAILDRMPAQEAGVTRQLMSYPPDTAGGLMITEFVAYPDDISVRDVVDDLRTHGERYSDYEIQYAYITDAEGRLAGVLRLRDLLLSPGSQLVRSIMITDLLHIGVDASLDDLKEFFAEHHYVGVPVTDADDRLVGVVRRAALEAALGAQATETFLAVSGLGEDELRNMPLLHRARRRLAWLSINIVLNVLAASVIAFYQDTLSAVIALAVFLPIISDMSGCSGNQAVAVSIRELSLGLVRPYEFLRVVAKEGALGIINGLALGLLLGTVAFLWKANVYLGLVVGVALMLNTVLAVLLGGLIPLALKGMKQDPALASGPILTTVTDMMGFLMVLGFASLLLTKLA